MWHTNGLIHVNTTYPDAASGATWRSAPECCEHAKFLYKLCSVHTCFVLGGPSVQQFGNLHLVKNTGRAGSNVV